MVFLSDDVNVFLKIFLLLLSVMVFKCIIVVIFFS